MLPALSHSLAPTAEHSGGPRRGFQSISKPGKELHSDFPGKSEHHLGKVFVNLRRARTPAKFASVEGRRGFQIEVSFPDEDCTAHNPLHRTQYRQGSFLKLEGRGVPAQGVIVEAKGLAYANLAELPVVRVRIRKCKAFFGYGNNESLLGNGEQKVQLNKSLKIQGLCLRFETLPRYPHRIPPGLQIRGQKLAQPVRQKHNWLRHVSAGYLDPRTSNPRARRIL